MLMMMMEHTRVRLGATFQVFDGVTTHLELEFGAFPVPEFYAAREGSSVINFGCSAGHIMARMELRHRARELAASQCKTSS